MCEEICMCLVDGANEDIFTHDDATWGGVARSI